MNEIATGSARRPAGRFILRCAAAVIVSLAVGFTPGCGRAEPPAADSPESAPTQVDAQAATGPIDDILGAWKADLEHNGQTERYGVEFERGDEGAVIARVSIPPLDVWSVPAWPVTMEGNNVQMGTTTLSYDPVAGTLAGVMAEGMVPVHRIPLTLRRVESIERPADDRPELPTRDPLWTFTTGGPIWAGVTYAAGIVYVGSDDGIVYALDGKRGVESWRFASEGAIRARPVLDGTFLLVHSDDGYLYRLEAKDGSVDWRARLGPSLQRIEHGDEKYRYDGYASGAAVADGIIYISHTEGRLLALDAATGEERWEFKADDHIASTPLVRNGRVYFGSFDGRVRAVHAESGALLWEHDTGAAVSSSAIWYDEKVIIGSRSFDLLALNAGDGSIAWSYYYWFSWIESSAVVRDGIAYIGASDSQLLHAIDAGTGRLVWEFDTSGSAWAEPAVSGDTVFIGAAGVADYMVEHDGGFFAVDLESGRGLWHVPSERPGEEKLWGFTSSPAVGDGMVFAGGLDGTVYAFSSSK